MRPSIAKEFGARTPRAVVLDDNANARAMMARRLQGAGFEVDTYADVSSFLGAWLPGTVDVIVADWDLSSLPSERGDRVLEAIRRRDWDVPFVLVSGKLGEDEKRVGVLGNLLECGAARFVQRGRDGIRKACDEAQSLIERRDLALLKVILALRPAALGGATIATSSGEQSAADLLAELVSSPSASHDVERPLARSLADDAIGDVE